MPARPRKEPERGETKRHERGETKSYEKKERKEDMTERGHGKKGKR